MKLSTVLPIRVVSEANMREHWAAKASRAKTQRLLVGMALHKDLERFHDCRHILVTLTRIGARPLDDDNLAISFKHVRDQIATGVGIDDGSNKYLWRYAQERGKSGEYAVRVEIEGEPYE